MPRPGGLGRGIPERAGVGDGDKRAGGDGKEGAQRGQQRWGVGGREWGEFSFYICRSKMRTIFPNRITNSYYGAGDNNS
jgi:hypothetical protein